MSLIVMDLLRTFPTLRLFGPPGSHSEGPFHQVVLDVLQAFACFRPDLGYVQGMSFIAAVAALHVAGTAVWASRATDAAAAAPASPDPRAAPLADAASPTPLSPAPRRYHAVLGTYTSPASPTPGGAGGAMPWASPSLAGVPPPPYTRSLSALSPAAGIPPAWRMAVLPALPVSPGFGSPEPAAIPAGGKGAGAAPGAPDTPAPGGEATPAAARRRGGAGFARPPPLPASALVVGDHTYLTFQLFANLLARHHCYVFFAMDAAAIAPYFALFDALLAARQPDVARKLRSLGVSTEMYLFGWLQTLFLKALPLGAAVRVWDVFLLDGVLHLYRTALALFDLMAPHILAPAAGFEEVVGLLTQGNGWAHVWASVTDADVLFRAIDAVAVPPDAVIQMEDLSGDPFFYRHVAER
jgi:hypothetical protein